MASRALPLDPDARSTLRALLLPPDGFELDHALATAYSLDMETLVTIPLFAAGLAAEEIDKPVGISKIYELGQRLTLLVQGDRIKLTQRWTRSRSLVQLVSHAVVPCSAGDGSFHPKLLVLKYKDIEKPKKALYRLVVATRNLTVDNSWDSVLVLDEDPAGQLLPGLSDTIAGLAQFINEERHSAIALCGQLGRALANVRFQLPRGLTDMAIHLFTPGSDVARGVLNRLRGDDLLVISPFVRLETLLQLAGQAGATGRRRWLVTRPVDVPPLAFEHYQVFQLADGAIPARAKASSEAGQATEAPEAPETSEVEDGLCGLHAKLYLASSKKSGTQIVITSANATPAGWRSNVEVAVTASAKGNSHQVAALMAERASHDQERRFRDLLEKFTLSAVIREEKEPDWERKARRALARAAVKGEVSKGPPRSLSVRLDVPGDAGLGLQDVEVAMHPFGYPNFNAPLRMAGQRLAGSVDVQSGIELVPFIVLTLTMREQKPLEIVLAMQLSGDLDWGREEARKTLARQARPWLLRELLWYFGVKGSKNGRRKTGKPAPERRGEREEDDILPVLEKILLRVHGPRSKAEVEMIDSLLAGVTNDEEYEPLIRMWETVKESLK